MSSKHTTVSVTKHIECCVNLIIFRGDFEDEGFFFSKLLFSLKINKLPKFS